MSEPTGRTLRAGPARMIERVFAYWRERVQQSPEFDEEFDNPLHYDKQYLARELDDEFDHCSLYAMERMAPEFGMTGQNLNVLVERGTEAADLLRHRMAVRGIAMSAVERFGHGLLRDAEEICSRCEEKAACGRDLDNRPLEPGWWHYCPNAITFDAMRKMRGCFPT